VEICVRGEHPLQYRKLKTLLNRLEKLSQTILRRQAKLAQSHRR